MKVTVKLGEGSVYVGEIDIDTDGDSGEDVDQQRLRSAAVAWNALTRNGVFEVDGAPFTAAECSEWWA